MRLKEIYQNPPRNGARNKLGNWQIDYTRWAKRPPPEQAYQLLINLTGATPQPKESKTMSSKNWVEYEKRVNDLEAEGLTRSDAQAIVDAEDLQRKAGN